MNIEIKPKDENISWEELTKLYHDAFQERLDEGMNFICSSFTPEDLKKNGENNVILVAIDKDNDAMAGAAMIGIVQDNSGTWGYMTNMAICPEYKRCGIGSKLEKCRIEVAKANGCNYVLSDTAVGATSSVNWHLKNGFRKIDFKSWPNTNYYSIVFRKQLLYQPLWSNPLFCKLHYWCSAIKCKACFYENGDYKKILKLLIRLQII